jgi:2-polyprenyl-6-hydroxyphenyl methylase/3-demethylubiquinone-9 3-methyltransferase
MTAPKNQVCLTYDGDALAAVQFYAETFPDTEMTRLVHAPGDYPAGTEGAVLVVEFTCLGIPAIALNAGPAFQHTNAFSFQVMTEDQAETDRYWNAIVGNGGEESACGWCRDKWGVAWQITPRQLTAIWDHPDPAATKRGFEAMMTMRKIDIAAIEAAVAGPTP